MIYAFKNTDPGVTACDFLDKLSDYTAFDSLFVVDEDYYFASSDITDAQVWRDQITLNNIIPLYDCKETEPAHDEPIRQIGIQDKEIELYKGKYKFTLTFNYDNDLYQKIIKLHNKPAYVYLQDNNKNILGILDGTDIFGIRCELFTVQKIIFGDSQQPSGLKVYLVIEPTQTDNLSVTQSTFTSKEIIYYPIQYFEEIGVPPVVEYYEIDDVYAGGVGVGATVTVEVLDNLGDPGDGFDEEDFSFVDDLSGALEIYYFNEGSPGVYTFIVDHVPTTGYVYLDTEFGVINYNYDVNSLTLDYSLDFDSYYSDIQDGYDQLIPNDWNADNSLFTFDEEYNLDRQAGNGNLLVTIFAGAGTSDFGIASDDAFMYGGYASRYFEMTYKSPIAYGTVDVFSWGTVSGNSILRQIDIEDTGGEFITVGVQMYTLSYPTDTYFGVGFKFNIAQAGSQQQLEVQEIKVYIIN